MSGLQNIQNILLYVISYLLWPNLSVSPHVRPRKISGRRRDLHSQIVLRIHEKNGTYWCKHKRESYDSHNKQPDTLYVKVLIHPYVSSIVLAKLMADFTQRIVRIKKQIEFAWYEYDRYWTDSIKASYATLHKNASVCPSLGPRITNGRWMNM